LYELELAMAGFELRGDADRAQEVIDVVLKVSPASITHHQKRVEYAVRSRDRDRLTYSYLELADALFRSGAGDKAVAVYGRVLELEPGNERAEFALSTLAPEELVRLRGGTVRPERWTDELAAISTGGKPASPPPVDEPATSSNAAELPVKEIYPPPPQSQRIRFRSLELPVPDWGEGVPVRGSSPLGPRPRATPVRQQPVVQPPVPAARDEELAREEAAEALQDVSPVIDAARSSGSSPRIPTPSVVPGPRSLTPAAPPSDWMATPPSAPSPPAPTPPSVLTPRSATPLSVPAPRAPTPAPMLVPRNPTPPPVPTTRTATPYSVPSPLENTDSDFIDLGEWLRNTEPVRSTRMQVEDPKPTGDEQADFEEMLRRFKRGVAENVEAEDYEAHYDLGVAYQELG
jgi:hypothetical protein